jgi:NADPH:quinone reductase-like Zn-dependent oxidoreductase
MRAAGIRQYSAPVESLELPGPGELCPDEVLLEVHGCGVENWDDIARSGGWDLGRHPPMALGVEAAGVVAATGAAVVGVAAGDRVMTHSLPLRAQGAWAEWFVAQEMWALFAVYHAICQLIGAGVDAAGIPRTRSASRTPSPPRPAPSRRLPPCPA